VVGRAKWIAFINTQVFCTSLTILHSPGPLRYTLFLLRIYITIPIKLIYLTVLTVDQLNSNIQFNAVWRCAISFIFLTDSLNIIFKAPAGLLTTD
jgi:hypothetical protein